MNQRLPSLILLVACATFIASPTTQAVENPAAEGDAVAAEPPANLDAGKRIWAETAECVRCHGWSGNGVPQGPGFPPGANLRELNLPPEALTEFIRCGVPGSEMPFFGRGAWSTRYPCFNMTAEDAGDSVPPADEHQLSDAQIATLVDYIEYQIMGHGPLNLADCEAFYGAGARQCSQLE
jgi:cytochrome c553